ncbi:hypothetical protein [Pseudomonas sp. LP_7_YM]|uniref:hypothetical protein n=1 Tax=Pseudomonas sp. LP_7_YM TaxID=2485137 RepID=UPI001060A7AB|nr:hypothetical protein [Pseudomonas sp. LP_7_YM]TDV62594.1 hypothetical protein EC915_107180 [Pseudomonas sp. LP_7_YM]
MRVSHYNSTPGTSIGPGEIAPEHSQAQSASTKNLASANNSIHFGNGESSGGAPPQAANDITKTSTLAPLGKLLSRLFTAKAESPNGPESVQKAQVSKEQKPAGEVAADSAKTPVNATPAVQQGPSPEQQQAIDGESTDIPSPDEKAPPGFDVKKINELNGGLLGKLGNNQEVKKDDKSVGNLRDVLAKDPNVHGDIDNDPDAAWRAYKVLTAVKNEKNPDDSDKPTDFRHNGSIGGYTKGSWGDAAGGSEAGTLQDYLVKGRTPSRREDQRDPHCGSNGGGTNGLQTFGNMVKYGFEDFGKMIVDSAKKVGKAFSDLGHDIANGFNHFGQMVKHGFEGIGDWIRGDNEAKEKEWAEARDNGSKLGDDIKDGFKQLGTIGEELGPLLLNAIPGVGTELSVAVTAAKFGAEMALKAGLKAGTKEFVDMALKEGTKELAKGTAKAAGKAEAKAAGEQVYEDITGEKPSDTAKDVAGDAKDRIEPVAGEMKKDVRSVA